MKSRNVFTKLAIIIAGAALLATAAFWQAGRARAFAPNIDPPTFGIVSIVSGQAVRLNVLCSQHGVGGFPPDPCRGVLMFHDAEGGDLQRVPYALMPGQTMSLEQGFMQGGSIHMTIGPCIIPAPDNRGRAIPSVEVFDTTSGKSEIVVMPIPRLSEIQGGSGGGQPAPNDTTGP
jgi:hypothetical protein